MVKSFFFYLLVVIAFSLPMFLAPMEDSASGFIAKTINLK